MKLRHLPDEMVLGLILEKLGRQVPISHNSIFIRV